ncbi:MAG: DUF5722 domain-containing protein [Pirellulales bacterium]
MLRRRLAWLVAVAALIAPAIARSQEASRYVDDYPHAASKKGLQVELVDDALALGVKHAALNVNLTEIVAPDAAATDAGLLEWTYDGDVYRFHAGYVQRLDRDIKALSDHGVVVQLIILAYASGNATVDRCMLHPGYDRAAPNRLGAFNTVSDEGRRWFTATMEFLAERWSRPDERYGRVAGYIIGNEVNSHWWWCNMGRVSMREFADDYLPAVRLAHDAVRRQSSWARVYTSLEHHWNMRYPAGDDQQAFAGRAFLDYFAAQARAGGDFDWHVAFHPYPENLFEPRFWLDESAQPSPETPRITFKNADVLTDYLERPELLYRGAPRRVIFSEQGFHTPDGPDGEAIQAAAYCYAYRTVAALDGVDAFILHRHVDHPHEGGLQLGLRRRTTGAADPYPKKQIYDCFRAADTPEWEAAFEFALPIVGLEHWD